MKTFMRTGTIKGLSFNSFTIRTIIELVFFFVVELVCIVVQMVRMEMVFSKE